MNTDAISANDAIANLSKILEPQEETEHYKVQFEKAAEILDLCCMQLTSVSQDIEESTGDLTEVFFSISASVKAIQDGNDSREACDEIMQNMRKLTISYQANDEYCQRLSHLQNTLAMLAILIRSKLLRELSTEWEELYNSILSNKSIRKQHHVFQAAAKGEELSTNAADEEDYELF